MSVLQLLLAKLGALTLLTTAAPQNPSLPNPVSGRAPGTDLGQHRLLIKLMAKEFKHEHFRRAEGPVAEKLYAMVNAIYAEIPERMPEARHQPLKPILYLYDDTDLNAEAEYEHDPSRPGAANAIAISTGFLSKPAVMQKANLAHEIGHLIIFANPDLLAKLPPADEKLAGSDLEAQGVLHNRVATLSYLNEIAADRAGVVLLHEKTGFEQTFDLFARDERSDLTEEMTRFVSDYRSRHHHRLPTAWRLQRAAREIIQEQAIESPEETHPSALVRKREVDIVYADLASPSAEPASKSFQAALRSRNSRASQR